jgi:N-acetylglucosamine-6-sulfatase
MMDRAEFLKRATAGAAGLALGTAVTSQRSATSQTARPNILLIMTDDQPYYTTGAMESFQKRMVATGMRFTNGYVATPICGPARGSVLTGKWSHTTGLEDTVGAWQDLVNSGELARNIAQRLQPRGYACHLAGKFTNDLSNGRWVCPGFDSWWAQLEDLNNPNHFYFSKGGDGRVEIPRNGTNAGNETMVATSHTERFIRNHKGAPWFACFWPHAPHGPYYPLDRYAGSHQGDTPPTPFGEPGGDLSDKAPLVRELARRSDAAKTDMMREYRGRLREVEEVDEAVNRLMNALVETNQIGRTWIFFVTDNGFQHGEHFLDKKLWPYEESARTPFVVRGPGVKPNTPNGHLVSQIDLLPTICEIAGADGSGVDGRSLLPILRDPSAPFRQFLLVEAEARGWHSVRMRKWNATRAKFDNFLFVKWRGQNGFEELYDYDSDEHQYNGRVNTPREQNNVEMLRQKLLAMRTSVGEQYRALEIS